METAVFVVILTLARLRGTRIIWTIHDLGSNDRLHPRLEHWFWNWFTQRIDAIIGLTHHSLTLADERFRSIRQLPRYVIPHGHYADAYPQHLSQTKARALLNLPDSATVVLHFGLLRPYKNVPDLIRCFASANLSEAILLVAGKPFDEVIERQVQECAEHYCASQTDIRLVLQHIPDADVAMYFSAADLVVLPYERILNSGAVILALSQNKPVLVPALGSMQEHQTSFGDQWIRLYTDNLTADHLVAAVGWVNKTRRSTPNLQTLDWTELARQTKEAYDKL